MHKKTFSASNLLSLLAILVISLIFLFPIFIIVMNTFKIVPDELYLNVLNIIPNQPTLDNYMHIFQDTTYIGYFGNTFYVAFFATILTVLFNSMAGYALAKYTFKIRGLILLLFMGTVMIPLEVIMIPVFNVIAKTGLYNSLWGLIIPTVATPTGLLIVRQYMLSIPDDLIEAGRIDGASEFSIFFRLILPIAKPVLASLAIFSFMWRWNDYIFPLIVISKPKYYTIQLAIANFAGENNVNWGGLLATSIFAMIPVVVIFIIFQKQFTQGVATSGMKE